MQMHKVDEETDPASDRHRHPYTSQTNRHAQTTKRTRQTETQTDVHMIGDRPPSVGLVGHAERPTDKPCTLEY